MIKKNVKIGSVKCDVLDFGFGSISMQPSYLIDEKSPALLLKTDDSGKKVGDENDEFHGKTSDDYKPEIALVFNNEASLDALIKSLKDCREHFKN